MTQIQKKHEKDKPIELINDLNGRIAIHEKMWR
jgi:hypothetical protein